MPSYVYTTLHVTVWSVCINFLFQNQAFQFADIRSVISISLKMRNRRFGWKKSPHRRSPMRCLRFSAVKILYTDGYVAKLALRWKGFYRRASYFFLCAYTGTMNAQTWKLEWKTEHRSPASCHSWTRARSTAAPKCRFCARSASRKRKHRTFTGNKNTELLLTLRKCWKDSERKILGRVPWKHWVRA